MPNSLNIFIWLVFAFVSVSASGTPLFEQEYTPASRHGTLNQVIDKKYACSEQNIRIIFDQRLMIYFENTAGQISDWKSTALASRYDEKDGVLVASGYRSENSFKIIVDHNKRTIHFSYEFDSGYEIIPGESWTFENCDAV